MEHDAVALCAVVARPDEKWGETPCAFVETTEDVDAAELAGEVEALVGVARDGEGLLLEALRLEEARDAVVLALRHRGQDGLGGGEVAAHDGGLILEHGEQQQRGSFVAI